MTGGPGAKGAPHTFTDERFDPLLHDPRVLAWMEEHLTELRRSVSERRRSMPTRQRCARRTKPQATRHQ
jgi:hypothetical protein